MSASIAPYAGGRAWPESAGRSGAERGPSVGRGISRHDPTQGSPSHRVLPREPPVIPPALALDRELWVRGRIPAQPWAPGASDPYPTGLSGNQAGHVDSTKNLASGPGPIPTRDVYAPIRSGVGQHLERTSRTPGPGSRRAPGSRSPVPRATAGARRGRSRPPPLWAVGRPWLEIRRAGSADPLRPK